MAAPNPQRTQRGAVLLLEHCAALARLGGPRRSPVARLEAVLGPELAHVLVHGLASRARSRPA